MPPHSGAPRSRDRGADPAGARAADVGSSRDRLALSLHLCVAALAVVYLIRLWRMAVPAAFASDECFHAYLAEWIAGHGTLPGALPEFYSGLPYFYPPLFHLVAAAALALAGPAALPVLNVVLAGVLNAVLLLVPIAGIPGAARRSAVLLIIASGALSLYAVRFYAETLATLLAVLALLALVATRARPGVARGLLLGAAVGAAWLAKQPAGVLPVLLLGLAGFDLARRRPRHATAMLIALGVASLVALPWLARNATLFGGALYPPVTRDAQVTLDAMNTRLFSLAAPDFYRNALIVMGPIVPWLAGLALAFRLWHRRFELTTGLIAACLLFVLLAPLLPRFQPRHLNPVTAMLALLGCMVLFDALRGKRRLALALQTALLVWGVVFVARLHGLRAGLDASPADREVYRAIAAHVPPGARVLSRSTYDTFYYARRPATWPIPWGESAGQLELFTVDDPDRFLAALDRESIGYLVVPRRATGRRFNGANYPESFIDCVATLVARGRLVMLWNSDQTALLGRPR